MDAYCEAIGKFVWILLSSRGMTDSKISFQFFFDTHARSPKVIEKAEGGAGGLD
jgi:hypothetical protein